MSAEQTPDIERVLAEHDGWSAGGVWSAGGGNLECDCGQRLRALGASVSLADCEEIHRAHVAQALAPVLDAAVREAEQRALRELSKAETEAIDRWMDDHMYGHQISNSYAGMSCNTQCRTRALGMAVDRVLADRVAEPQHEAATSGKESEASDE